MRSLADSDGAFALSDQDTALAQFIMGLRSRGVRSKELLITFEKTPRGAFVQNSNPALVYAPHALPIPCGAEATSPVTIAHVLAALDLKPGMKVLEIGTGSGFQAAVLAGMGCHVLTIERFQTLHQNAARVMKRLGVVNVRLDWGDGLGGLPDEAPFDRILVNAALREVPDALVEQLAPGGTIVAPIMLGKSQRLYAFDDADENFRQRDLGPCAFQQIGKGRSLVL